MMTTKNAALSLLFMAGLAGPAMAQDGTPDDVIEFCGSWGHEFGLLDFEVAVKGNLYAVPNSTDANYGLTVIKYFGAATAPEFDSYAPVPSPGNGSAAFAGDTLVYAEWIDQDDAYGSYNTIRVVLYDIDPETGDLGTPTDFDLSAPDHQFSISRPDIAADGDVFAVAGGGTTSPDAIRVHVFRKTGSGWSSTPEQVITRNSFRYVKDLALDGDTLVISYSDDQVDIYNYDSVNGWVYDESISPNLSDVTDVSDFGAALAIEGNRIAVGDPWADTYDTITMDDQRSGAVFIYDYTGQTLTHEETIYEHDGTDAPSTRRDFGGSIDFSDDGSQLIVGARNFDRVANSYYHLGAAFLYDTSDYSAYEEMFIDNSNTDGDSGTFGRCVRISGNLLSIMNHQHNGGCSSYDPAILIYDDAINETPCSDADLAQSYGQLDFFDVSTFLTLYNAMDPVADWNNDGNYNFFDVSGFLTDFQAGCP